MKKILYVTLFLTAISSANATETPTTGAFLADILLARPAGIVLTVVGSALFVGTSPFTALAYISPPHDAFDIALKTLVLNPVAFTFHRPVGVLSADDDGVYRR